MSISELTNLPRQSRKRGPKPLALNDLRVHTISVRLNSSELAWLDNARKLVNMQRGQYLRAASHGVLPLTIPAINREAWSNLTHIFEKLYRFQENSNKASIAVFPTEDIRLLINLIIKLRVELLGIAKDSESV